MKELNTIVDHLAAFAREQKLVARSLEGCSLLLRNEAKGNRLPRRLDPAAVKMNFRSHSLTFESGMLSFPYISTQLDLYVETEEIGWYKLVVRLDGENEDDYLVFYHAWKNE